MDCKEALEFADNLIYASTGKHLNDLEREVFTGSWQGQTYEEIYPINPEYVEKYVGYKLWQKLSDSLGEKVTKKKVKGALERAIERQGKSGNQLVKKVFISYRSQEPDSSLAAQFCEAISAAGHKAFITNLGASSPGSIQPAEDWLSQLDSQLKECDCFLLLLSPQAAVSEMVIEELQRARQLRDSRHNSKPVVLPIRVNFPPNLSLNHDLQSYLHGTVQNEWVSPADTARIVRDVLKQLAEGVEKGQPQKIEEWESAGNSLTSTSPSLSSNTPPSPVAEPELPSGQVRLASAFYVERVPCETQCYKEILQPGCLIRIKAPRQMGKTSLMARILYQAKEQGYRTVPLSFQHADTAVFTNLKELLQWFCAKISRKLRLPYQVDDYWSDTYGSKDNCTAFFEDCLLPETDSPLVLGLDEIDRVFHYPKIADDFFGLLRAWYEEAGYGANEGYVWEKLRLVVVHSTEVYIPLDINQSPFNVGLPIELSEFSTDQVFDLACRHGLNWGESEVKQLMTIVGGHPYLVRLALYYIAGQQLTLRQLAEIAPTEAGIYGDHLRRHLWNLQQHPNLAEAFAKVVVTNKPVELESVPAFKLHSLGLVQLRGNEVTPRFDLYRQYFRDRLNKISSS